MTGPLYARMAALFLFVAGATGSLLFVLAALRVPLVPVTFILSLLAALVVVILRRRDLRGAPFPRADILPLLVLVAPFVLVAWIVTIIPLADYDGRATWMPKAEAIAREGSAQGPFFEGERGLNLHNRYPLLVPLDVALLMTLGVPVRHFFWLIPCAALVWCFGAVREHYGRAASWVVVFAAWLPQVVAKGEGSALSAYVDLTVMAFLGAAVLCGLFSPRWIGPWLAFLVLTKNEGIILALIVAAILRWRALAWPAGAAAVLWWWRRSVPPAYDEQYEVLVRFLPERLHRLDDALLALARHALDWRDWGLFWIAVLIAGLWTRSKPFFVCLATLAAYALTFTVTSWNIDELASVAADRLLVHLVIPATIAVAALLQFATLGPLRTEAREGERT